MSKFFKFLLLLLPIGIFAQPIQNVNSNGYNVFYYDNGKISSEGTLRDGKPDLYWKTYSNIGTLKSEGNRKNFQLDSIWKFYNEKGILAFEFTYKDGKKTGLKKTYDSENGFLVTSENYINDIKQGNTINYYKPAKSEIANKVLLAMDSTKQVINQEIENNVGNTKKIIPFLNGKEEGQGFEYSIDSVIITITQYKMGFVQQEEKINRRNILNQKKGIWKEFYPSGIIKKEVEYFDDKMDGYLKEYSSKGSLLSTTKYVKGVIQKNVPELAKLDTKNEYYEGGFLKSTGTYKNGLPEGIHRQFSPDGKVLSAKIYTDGILLSEGIIDVAGVQQGLWKELHPNGQIKSKGEYLNGKRIGEWVYYFSNGKVEQKGKYDNKGKAQGIWKWYYPCFDPCTNETGQLWREENYRNNLLDGSMIEYSDSGKVITKGEFADGEKEGKWMLELADYREEGEFRSGKRSGEWKHYFVETGNLRFVGKFIDDVPDGKQIFYYPNGKEKQNGKYVGGMKDGEWKFYDETGYLFLTILFKNDIELRFDGIKVIPETVQ
jgi:antitoxin component YwqK of YwqJK toxin-antitoxin module